MRRQKAITVRAFQRRQRAKRFVRELNYFLRSDFFVFNVAMISLILSIANLAH